MLFSGVKEAGLHPWISPLIEPLVSLCVRFLRNFAIKIRIFR